MYFFKASTLVFLCAEKRNYQAKDKNERHRRHHEFALIIPAAKPLLMRLQYRTPAVREKRRKRKNQPFYGEALFFFGRFLFTEKEKRNGEQRQYEVKHD